MIEQLKQLANAGETDAQLNYGLCFFTGRGVERDLVQARFWYEKAAYAGNSAAQFNYAGLYFDGDGVEKDLAKALRWYRRAAEQCHGLALVHMASLYEKGIVVERDETRVLAMYLMAYRRGSMRAAVHLGFMYEKARGVPRDPEQAYQLFREAIDMRDNPADPPNVTYKRSAFYWLGKLTEELIPEVYKDALDWYERGKSLGCQACAEAVSRLVATMPKSRQRDKHSRDHA